MEQRILYITYLRKTNPEEFFVSGTFDETFNVTSLRHRRAIWNGKNKHWVVQKEHLPAIRQEALKAYDKVMYSEGGDFVEL